MLNKLIIATLAITAVLGIGQVAYATDQDGAPGRTGVLNQVERKVESTVQTVESNEPTGTVTRVREEVSSQRQQIEDRKLELKQRLDAKAAERKERLEGRRLAQCQNRQDDINALLDRSVSNGRERLAKIQRFEEGVKAFYDKQELKSGDYEAAVAAVDDKEAAAIAALDTIAAEEFLCDEVDPAKPAETIRTTQDIKQTALKEYRQSVVDLIKVVRTALEAKQTQEPTNE